MDMLLKAVSFELKKEYPNIFVSETGGEVFIFRPLTKYEYEEIVISTDLSDEDKAENVCMLCVLWPQDYDFENCEKGALPEKLSKEIIDVSDFRSDNLINKLIDKNRELNEDDIDYFIENTICAAFTKILPEDIKNWDIYKILDYFSRAQWILQNLKVQQIQQAPPGSPNVNHPPATGAQREVQQQKSFNK